MSNPFLDGIPEQRVVENDLCVFVTTPQPILQGSGLIVTKEIREMVFDLTPDEWTATFELLQAARLYLDKAFRPDGYNVGWNVGRIGGQEIPHVHLHVIPRFSDEPLAVRGIRHQLKQPENKRP